jgi:hypothetical protein
MLFLLLKSMGIHTSRYAHMYECRVYKRTVTYAYKDFSLISHRRRQRTLTLCEGKNLIQIDVNIGDWNSAGNFFPLRRFILPFLFLALHRNSSTCDLI